MLITSKDNGNIKTLSKLLSNKKYRNEMGVFVVEGMRNCVDVLKQSQEEKTQIKWVFYTEDSIENYKKNFDVSCVLNLDENKKFCITKEIAYMISLEENNQGIFVVAKKLDLEFSLENLN
ncbi:MAG: RNA methyltransferase, partial [Oscillospiraceae bacterium]|nr:RNA methyltransferase [Oscillospiraceae bacterium]